MSTIYDVHGNPIDPTWMAEFAGFFLADGSLVIGRYYRNQRDRHSTPRYRYHFFRPQADINQRDDNRPVLEAICAKLGGHVTKNHVMRDITHWHGKTYPTKPRVSWHCVGKANVQRILDIIRRCQLPHRALAKKIATMQEYLDLVQGPGVKYGEDGRAKMIDLWERMRACHVYEEQS